MICRELDALKIQCKIMIFNKSQIIIIRTGCFTLVGHSGDSNQQQKKVDKNIPNNSYNHYQNILLNSIDIIQKAKLSRGAMLILFSQKKVTRQD